jgi:DNA-directed RNA polymerase subunit M/transcription elongation factor TFIIS
LIQTEDKCPKCNSILYQTETVNFEELCCIQCGFIRKNYGKPIEKKYVAIRTRNLRKAGFVKIKKLDAWIPKPLEFWCRDV